MGIQQGSHICVYHKKKEEVFMVLFIIVVLTMPIDYYSYYMLYNAYVDYSHTIEVVDDIGYKAEKNLLSRRIMQLLKTRDNWELAKYAYMSGLLITYNLLPKKINDIFAFTVSTGHFICGIYSYKNSPHYKFNGDFVLPIIYKRFK